MRWMALAFPLTILMCCISFVNFIFWQQDATLDIRQRQLDLQVNYAADAAMQDLLERGTHINTDYADWGYMDVEPQLALDTYEAVLLRNFGWADNEENRKYLEDYSIPFFIVAGYDGYYVYYKQMNETVTPLLDNNGNVIKQVKNVTYDLMWTPKLPYAETVVEGGVEKQRFYNLGENVYGTVVGSTVKLNNEMSTNDIALKDTCVASTLTDAANSALYAGVYGDVTEKFYIPNTFSQWANNNPIESVSIITYAADPINVVTKEDWSISAFGVTGAKIDAPQYCILYKDTDGTLLYTYEENRTHVETERGLNIIGVVMDPVEAAERGHYFDVTYL